MRLSAPVIAQHPVCLTTRMKSIAINPTKARLVIEFSEGRDESKKVNCGKVSPECCVTSVTSVSRVAIGYLETFC